MRQISAATKDEAALMCAEGRFDYCEIAEKLGISIRVLHKWRKQPDFLKKVEEISADLKARALKRGIARQDYRLKCLADRHSLLLQVIEERSNSEDMQDVPGGSTGLMVRKIIASSGVQIGEEYVVDAGTLRELRDIEAAAGKELGQIIDKSESKVEAVVTERQMSDEQLNREYEALIGRTAGAKQTSES